MTEKTKGYIRHYDRDMCEDCVFYDSNFNSAPHQKWRTLCTFLDEPFDVYQYDYCDEFKKYEP